MTKNGLDIQPISTNRSELQTDRILLSGHMTEKKEKAAPSYFLKFLFANGIPIAIGSTFSFARHINRRLAKPKEPFYFNALIL